MTRKTGLLRRSLTAVTRLFRRGDGRQQDTLQTAPQLKPAKSLRRRRNASSGAPSRPLRREADVPMDMIESAYTPPATSSKASFRSDGSDHQQDQEIPIDTPWNDEDRYTNRSGDPRIGTRGRTYEPGEREESRE